MSVQVSNSEIMDIFKQIDVIRYNSNLTKEEIEKQVKEYHDLIMQKMSFLVLGHTRQYINFPNYEDLSQEGLVGLLKAVQKFEWRRYPNFFAFSARWIRNGVKKGASRFDVVYNPNRNRVIYAEPDENEADLDNPEEMFFNQERKDCIDKILDEFPERDKKIVQKIFGLEGQKPETLREIGPQFNLTYERVRQIKNNVMAKLRKNSRLQDMS